MALKLDRMQDTADVKRYARVVARAWMDPEYKARLVADPRPLLGAAGLDIPTEAEVRVVDADVTSIDASGSVITFGLPSAPKGGLGDESLTWRPRPDTKKCFSSCSEPGPHTTACVNSGGCHTGPFFC